MEGSGVALAVENVQALASNKNLQSVPHRYIRPELALDDINQAPDGQIPVIDISRLIDERYFQDEMNKLHLACQDWGFFQLVNHGLEEEAKKKMVSDVSEFFKLPLEVKKACHQGANKQEGYGQSFVFSEEQKLDWGDMLYLFTLPLDSRNMKIWPAHPPTFEESLRKYSSEMDRIKTILLHLMEKNLGIEEGKLTEVFKNGLQSIRMNYYPPCPQASKVLGISPHSDATGITVLLQLNEVQGLQIRRNGQWFPVTLLPNALLVNIGDVLEILSNGRYKSIEHRVVINKNKERMSVAAFHDANMSAQIGPLPELTKGGADEHKYRTVSFEEYVKLLVSHKLDGKSLVDLMKLNKY